jgi:hypothetical protein
MFARVPLSLYRSRGDGTFEDVTTKSGLARYKGRGMAIAFGDYDQDGFLDVYVANDKLPSFLFAQPQGRNVREAALLAGVSLPERGQEISAMGVDFRDYDNDGRPDVHVTSAGGGELSACTGTWAAVSSRTSPLAPGSAPWWPRSAGGATASLTSTTTAGRTSSPRTRT